MGDFLKSLAFSLVPPWDTDPVKLRNWSWASALSIYALFFAAVWAAGFAPKMFGDGFALAGTFNETVAQQNQKFDSVTGMINDLRVKAIKEDISKNELARCRIMANKKAQDADLKQQALDYTNQQINTGVDQYFRLTKQAYQQQPCEVLMVGAGN